MPTSTDEQALKWLISEVMRQGQWALLAQAIRLVLDNGGHGRVTLVIRDGNVADHPKAEVSL